MTDVDALRSQTYSTNLSLLAQQFGSKFGQACITTPVSGAKAARLTSQLSSTTAQERTTRAEPAMNIRLDHTGRWVYFRQFDWGTVIDDIDLLQTNISPQGQYVRSGVSAMARTEDDLFLAAFFGTAKTGETGGTSTTFGSGLTDTNQVAVNLSGNNEGMTLAKMEQAMKYLLANEVDLDMEVPIIGISPLQHKELKSLTEVKSFDFNTRRVLGEDGMLKHFNGFDLIISNRLPTDSNSYRRCPVWVKSGMGRGLWKDISGQVRKRADLQGNPDYAETTMAMDFTRLEEARCVEIKCVE